MYNQTHINIKNKNQSLNYILTSYLSTHKTYISTKKQYSITQSSNLKTHTI